MDLPFLQPRCSQTRAYKPASQGNDSSPAAALQNAVAQTVSAPPSDSEQTQSDNAMMERMDVSRTLLRIRGFGDISLHGGTAQGETTSFSLGQLDLFVTSDVSDRFKFLSEIVFEAGPDNIYGQTTGRAQLVQRRCGAVSAPIFPQRLLQNFRGPGTHGHRVLQHRIPP